MSGHCCCIESEQDTSSASGTDEANATVQMVEGALYLGKEILRLMKFRKTTRAADPPGVFKTNGLAAVQSQAALLLCWVQVEAMTAPCWLALRP